MNVTVNKTIIRFLVAAMIPTMLVLAGIVGQVSVAGDRQANGGERMLGPGKPHPDLALVREVTAPYHDLQVAIAAGYPEDATGCLDFPDGYMDFGPGAMSTHWINWEYFNDGGSLNPAQPEALLYEPQEDGSLRLVAVEYIIPESDLPRTAEPPELFGRKLMFHPQFGVWGMHVWLWKYNPYGLYADVNPRVTCEFADQLGEAGAHSHQ